MGNKIKKPICFISTGGTISIKYDSFTSGFIPAVKANDLFEFLKSQNIYYDYEIFEYSNKPSPHITIEDMKNIADYVFLNKEKYHGFIITHGTDVLEETAFFFRYNFTKKYKMHSYSFYEINF